MIFDVIVNYIVSCLTSHITFGSNVEIHMKNSCSTWSQCLIRDYLEESLRKCGQCNITPAKEQSGLFVMQMLKLYSRPTPIRIKVGTGNLHSHKILRWIFYRQKTENSISHLQEDTFDILQALSSAPVGHQFRCSQRTWLNQMCERMWYVLWMTQKWI